MVVGGAVRRDMVSRLRWRWEMLLLSLNKGITPIGVIMDLDMTIVEFLKVDSLKP